MGNPKQQEVMDAIIEAVQVGNGWAAERAVEKINEEFILIRKSDLPKVEDNQFTRNPTARTATYRAGQKPSTYFNRALDFLAIAQHAEQEDEKQAERILSGKRAEAYKMLFPAGDHINFYYSSYPFSTQRQIDVVVGLMNQVDELKDSK